MFLQNTNTSTKIIENASQVKDAAWESISNLLTSIIARMPFILAGILVLLIFYALALAVKQIFWTVSKRTNLDNRLRILFSRLIAIFILILGIFTTLTVIVPSLGFGDLITGLGFTSFVIGFATKDILNNLLSGVLILWQQPFKIGDYIFVKDNQGKVEYIGVRATKLRKGDGELVLIPNGDMYSNALTMRGAGATRRMSLQISVGYETDVKRAKAIIQRVFQKIDGVVIAPQPRTLVTDLTSDGVDISIYFWIAADEDSPLQIFDRVATAIKEALSMAGVELFPPTSFIFEPPKKEETKQAEETEEETDEDWI